MATQNENPRLTGILEKVAISALFLIVTWQYNSITKLEDRMFNMQGEMFTEQKAKVLEERISKNIDAIRSDINSRLDLLISIQTSKQKQ